MRTFTPALAVDLARRNGAGAVWLLRFTAAGTDYILCQDAMPIPPWSKTALPWIASWGQLTEGVSSTLADFNISNLSIDLINDPAAATNLRALAKARALNGIAMSVYLWVDGCTDPPFEMNSFVVTEIDLPDEASVNVTLQDQSSNYENFYPGTHVTKEVYPEADPDDVGKVIPMPFGSVSKLITLALDSGRMTSIPNAISATTTTIPVSDPAGLAPGMLLQVDEEIISIVSIAASILTATRGVSGTLAATHQRGAAIWEVKDQFVYVAADYPVTSILKAYGRVGQILLDISELCTVWPAGDHPSYPGKAVICVPGYITLTQAIDMLVNDGIGVSDLLAVLDGTGVLDGITVSDNVGVSDLLTILDAAGVSDTIAVSDLIGVSDEANIFDGVGINDNIVVDPGSHNHTVDNLSTTQEAINNGAQCSNGGNVAAIWPAILPPSGSTLVGTDWACDIYVGSGGAGGSVNGIAIPAVGVGGTAHMHGHLYPSSTGISVVAANPQVLTMLNATRTVYFSAVNSASPATGVAKTGGAYRVGYISKTGAVTKTGSATKTGGATKTGSTTRSGSITKTGDAYRAGAVTKTGTVTRSGNVLKTGTVTVTGNSVANTLIGDAILVDVVSPITAPPDVINKILGTSCGLRGAFPAGFAFNGAITSSKRAPEWCHDLARQCRSYFKWVLGQPTLIVRPDVLAPVKSINEIRLNNGMMIHGQRQTDINDVINTINLRYDRDWSSTSSGDEVYQQVSAGTDAASITTYGVRERPELFRLDFVTSPTMAANLLAFYLAWQAWQRWQHTQEAYLFEAALEFGDAVTLAFLGGEIGECTEVGFSPGNGTNIDKIQLTVIE